MSAPLRAQRVRGIPGVGLRAPDGREWLRWGVGYRWDPDSIDAPTGPGWVRARCAHRTGEFVRMTDDTGLAWECCDQCTEMETFTVQSCTRPGAYGNPWVVMRKHGPGSAEWAIDRFTACRLPLWTDDMFAHVARFDYLSCYCPLDRPCHVDVVLEECRRRGVWT